MNSGCHGNQGETILSSLQKPMVKFQKNIADPWIIKWHSIKLFKEWWYIKQYGHGEHGQLSLYGYIENFKISEPNGRILK